MPNNLWQFTFSRLPSVGAAGEVYKQYTLPTLTSPTIGMLDYNGTGTGGGTIVNVKDGFLWTNSKKRAGGQGRDEAPYVVLVERKIKASSLIAQAKYSAGAAKDSLLAASKALGVGNTIASVGNALGITTLVTVENESSKTLFGSDIPSLVGKSFVGKTYQSLQNFFNKQTAFTQDDPNFLTQDYLNWYKGLYITEKTGWQFILPYFEDASQAVSNGWSDTASSNEASFFTGEISESFKVAAQKAADVFGGISSTGSYVESNKFYQYKSDGDSVTINFPLINTGAATFEDVVNNWQFIYLLLYNNKPERVNRNLIEPPPIYEATIQGVKYMPFAYISRLAITYQGARRTMKIPVPVVTGPTTTSSNYNADILTVIPEIYNVEITLQGMISDSKNFMYSLVQNQTVNVYDISQRPNNAPLTQLVNLISTINSPAGQIAKTILG